MYHLYLCGVSVYHLLSLYIYGSIYLCTSSSGDCTGYLDIIISSRNDHQANHWQATLRGWFFYRTSIQAIHGKQPSVDWSSFRTSSKRGMVCTLVKPLKASNLARLVLPENNNQATKGEQPCQVGSPWEHLIKPLRQATSLGWSSPGEHPIKSIKTSNSL